MDQHPRYHCRRTTPWPILVLRQQLCAVDPNLALVGAWNFAGVSGVLETSGIRGPHPVKWNSDANDQVASQTGRRMMSSRPRRITVRSILLKAAGSLSWFDNA